MRLKAIVWNMQHKPSNWVVLKEWQELEDTDIAILCHVQIHAGSSGPAARCGSSRW
jgi:hypothetical protein